MRAVVLGSWLLLLAVGLTLGSGCKADRTKCAKAAQHYAELVYWERENARIEKLPAADREDARKHALVAFNKEVDTQLDKWVQQCVAAGNDDQSDCINKSKTAKEALECADVAEGPGKRGCCDTGGGGGAPVGPLALAGLVGVVLLRRRGRR